MVCYRSSQYWRPRIIMLKRPFLCLKLQILHKYSLCYLWAKTDCNDLFDLYSIILL